MFHAINYWMDQQLSLRVEEQELSVILGRHQVEMQLPQLGLEPAPML